MFIIGKVKSLVQGSGRSGNVKKNIVASFAIKGISMLVSFALVPLTIGYVSSELYGVWLTLSSVLTWLSFLDIGFSKGLKNKLTEAIAHNNWEKGKSLVSTTYFMMILIFLPICLLLEIVIPYIDWCSLLNVSTQYSSEIMKAMHILVAMACLQMVVNVITSVVAAFQKVALSNAFMPIGNLISLVVIFVLTKTCPPSLTALAFSLAAMPVLITIIASVFLFIGQFRKVSPSFSLVKREHVKDLFGLGYKFFIINIQVIVLYQSTNILISNVSSPNEVTTYNIAYKLLSLAMMAYTIITAPLWPAYTDAFAREDYAWMKNVRKKMKKILTISVIGCFLVAFFSPWIYGLWVGDTPHVPFAMTLIVAIYVSVYCWMNLNGTLIVGMGKVNVETYIVLIGMIVHIPLSFLLSQYLGAYGVLCSLVFINFLYGIVMNMQVNMLLNKTAKGIWNQ
ncbi:oligosaccharide flippase family protein [Bacteroides congonensis]